MKTFPSALIALANDAPIAKDQADLPPGVLALANEARFDAANFSEALTQFTVGYRDPENLLAAVDYIAPPVPVSRKFEWKKGDASAHFLTELDDERAIGAGFKRVEYAGSSQLGKTVNRGLTFTIDTDEEGAVVNEEAIVGMIQQRIIRNKYRRAMAALAALSAGSGAVFSASTQPDELIKAALATAQEATGVYPNRGLMGLVAWNYRSAGYAAQDKAGAFAGLAKKPSDVAGDLMLDDLRIDKSLYQSSTSGKTRIVGSNFFGFLARDGLTKDDPSHLKQFYTPAGGGRFRVYREIKGPAGKFIQVTVEHYESIIATSTIGFARLNVTNT